MKRKIQVKDIIIYVVLIVLAVFCASPVIYVFWNSVNHGMTGYLDFFVWRPVYIKAMCNSLLIAGCSALGAMMVSIPSSFIYGKIRFCGSKGIFFLYIVIMLMPFQVTMLPHYILSKTLGVYDTLFSLILLGIFSPFPVFLLTQLTRKVPDEFFEAAYIETSSFAVIFRYIYFPLIWPGIVCSSILVFSDCWNAVSEPVVLLENKALFPIAMILNASEKLDYTSFAAAAIFCVIPLLLFMMFESEIKEGLGGYQLK